MTNMAALPTIKRINENLARLANGKSVRFLNVMEACDGKGSFTTG